jgi:long-chain acyl-CoA synthetase
MEAKAKYDEKPWLKFYPEGVPATIEIPERSLPEVFDEVAGKYSGRDAMIFYGNKIRKVEGGGRQIRDSPP